MPCATFGSMWSGEGRATCQCRTYGNPVGRTHCPRYRLTSSSATTLRFATETVAIDPDGSAGALPLLSRTIDRSCDALQRPTGYELKTDCDASASLILILETSLESRAFDSTHHLRPLPACGCRRDPVIQLAMPLIRRILMGCQSGCWRKYAPRFADPPSASPSGRAGNGHGIRGCRCAQPPATI